MVKSTTQEFFHKIEKLKGLTIKDFVQNVTVHNFLLVLLNASFQ